MRARLLLGGGALALAVLLVGARAATEERLRRGEAVALTSAAAAEAADALAARYARWFARRETTEGAAEEPFSTLAERVLAAHEGVEGGFFSADDGRFYGFAFPTSPPPPPAYGPPPREVGVIREVVAEAMAAGAPVVRWFDDYSHFAVAAAPVPDPASPIPYGAAWTLKRRPDLAPRPADPWLLAALGLALLGGAVILHVSVALRRQAAAVRAGLEALREDLAHRVPGPADPDLAAIAHAANEMAEALAFSREAERALAEGLARHERAAALGRLVAGVAHEVRTPLAAVKARLQLWLRRAPESVAHDPTVPEVVAQLDRLGRFVDHLYALARVGRLPLEPGDPLAALEAAARDVAPEAEAGHVQIVLPALPPVRPDLRINAAALEGVFANLLRNALQAGARRVEVRLDATPDRLTVAVHDDGPGLPAEGAARWFEPFYTTRADGLGLGLALAYEVVRHHGGTLEARPSDLGGAALVVTLPLAAPVAFPVDARTDAA